jgi:hypothetical protein
MNYPHVHYRSLPPKGADASLGAAWDQSNALKRELWSTREAS